MTLDGNKGLDVCSGGTPGREEGELAIANGAPDQQATGPQSGFRLAIFVGMEIGEFEARPVVKSCTFRALAGRKAMPCRRGKIAGNVCSGASDRGLACPRAKMMIRSDPQHIGYTSTPQGLLDFADTINSIRCDPGERDARRDCPADHLHRQRRLVGKGRVALNMSGGEPRGITSSAFRQI
jgi:hypothetical protein